MHYYWDPELITSYTKDLTSMHAVDAYLVRQEGTKLDIIEYLILKYNEAKLMSKILLFHKNISTLWRSQQLYLGKYRHNSSEKIENQETSFDVAILLSKLNVRSCRKGTHSAVYYGAITATTLQATDKNVSVLPHKVAFET